MLINNNFPNYIIDKQITKFLNEKSKSNNLTNDARRVEHQTPEMKIKKNQDFNNALKDDIKLYFRSQFTNKENDKVEEKELKTIIDKDVQHHDKDKHVKFLIYYKNRKVKNLFIENKTNIKSTNISEKYNVIYKYTCDRAPCNVTHTCYIGHSTGRPLM